jgi:hypothetical protein
MKKNNFRIDRLRKKLDKNENWLRCFVNRLKDDEDWWNDFKKFKCSEFFVGYQTSSINNKIYEKRMKSISRKFRLAGRICERIYKKELSDLYL